MVSYYNHPLAMYQKNHNGGSHLPYSTSAAAWYASNHQPPNPAQFFGDADSHSHPVYYPQMFHPSSSPDWTGHDNYAAPPQTVSHLQGPGSGNHGGPVGFLSVNQATQNLNNHNEHINDGLLPSPPITVSGSDMSSPGANNGSTSPHIHSRPTPVKSPYEWMKKPSYQSQPNPGKKFFAFNDVLVSINRLRSHTSPSCFVVIRSDNRIETLPSLRSLSIV